MIVLVFELLVWKTHAVAAGPVGILKGKPDSCFAPSAGIIL